MPPHTLSTTTKAASVMLAATLAVLALSACGGSSKGSNSSANASSTAPAAGATDRAGARFQALRECLQRNGITLPPRTPGQRGGGLFAGPGRQLPKGVTRAQLEATLRKCDADGFGRGARLGSPTYRAALASFAACMREHGVRLPAPNTSGRGPIFNTTGLNTRSAQFLRAEAACRRILPQARLPRAPGTRPPSASATS